MNTNAPRSFRTLFPAAIAACAFCAVSGAPAPARAQSKLQTINFDQAMQADELGNATVSIKITLSASQWQNWQQKYGQNKSLLKRDMNKYLSQYDTSDWDVSEKPMDRQVLITLKARGTMVYKGEGEFEFRLPKSWRGGDRTGSTYSFNYVEDIGGGVIGQNSVKLTLPARARNFRDETTTDRGERVIQYSLPVTGSRRWLLWLGLLSLCAGGGVLAFAFTSKTVR